MEALKNLFAKLSGRKLLLMPKTSASGVFSREFLTKDLMKLYARVADTTASLALACVSLRFGGKTKALLATLLTGARALSVASAASTSCLWAETTTADIGSSGTTSVPRDRTDEATWTLLGWITNIGAATAVAWIVWLSALWVLATLAIWARSMSIRRRSGSSGSPNTQAVRA
ncbi:unnamed protein product, partial [Ectocarpus sp. 12 AP-2014]